MPTINPSRATLAGAAIRLFTNPNPNARYSYHCITNKTINAIANYWKTPIDPVRGTKDQDINYLLLIDWIEEFESLNTPATN